MLTDSSLVDFVQKHSLSALLSVQGFHMDSLKAHILSCILVLPACTSRRHSGRPFWERKPLYLVRNWAAAPCCFWDFTVLQNEEEHLQNSRVWLLVSSQKKWLQFGISLNAMPALSSFFFLHENKHVYLRTAEQYKAEVRAYLTIPFHPTADTQYTPSAGAVTCTTWSKQEKNWLINPGDLTANPLLRPLSNLMLNSYTHF